MVAYQSYRIPSCLFSMAYCVMRRKIFSEAGFDVGQLDIAKYIKGTHISLNSKNLEQM